jgi:hypothetical protein
MFYYVQINCVSIVCYGEFERPMGRSDRPMEDVAHCGTGPTYPLFSLRIRIRLSLFRLPRPMKCIRYAQFIDNTALGRVNYFASAFMVSFTAIVGMLRKMYCSYINWLPWLLPSSVGSSCSFFFRLFRTLSTPK